LAGARLPDPRPPLLLKKLSVWYNAGDRHGEQLTFGRLPTCLDLFNMNLNKVFVLGNLTHDPELRATTSGHSVCSFSIATHHVFTDKSGQRQQQSEFHNIVAWGRQAEIIKQYLRKGSQLLVEGRLQTRDWLDDKGVKHFRTEVVAEALQLGPKLGKKVEARVDILADAAEEVAASAAPVAA
jgi:single-strand DNA-binding protein